MNRFYKKKSFKLLVIVVVILMALLAHTAYNGSFVLSNLLGMVTTPMERVSAAAAEGVSDGVERITLSYDELKAENERLKQEINELNGQLADYYQYRQENEQLKNFLDLKQDNPDYRFAYGSVVARDSADLFYRFRVDKGSLAGVKVHDPVITEAGLVGWVSSVSAVYCTVTTVLSPETNVAAYDKVSRDSGVITSDVKLADEGMLRLSYLEEGQTVKKGDMIVTSGIGGNYPKNLRIGKAIEVRSNETDVSLYATVKPYVDIKNVKDVLIITDFAGRGEALEATDSGEDTK